jgi:hypothetical protein|tara:strand:- start:834 stop:1160 length:327 start_codon:yes stop_codon:yes gene_type:complete
MIDKIKRTGIDTIKLVWDFFSDELPHVLSNWRLIPRLMMGLYCYAFYSTMNWFMLLDAPNNAQAGFVSVVVGAGAAWFGLYVNSGKVSSSPSSKVKIKKNKEVDTHIG